MLLGLMPPILPLAFVEDAATINKLYEEGNKKELKSKLKSCANDSEVMPYIWSLLKPEVKEELLKLGYKPTSSE